MVNLDFSALLVVIILSILLFLLQKLYFNRINKIIHERENVIRENNENFTKFLIEYNEKEKIINEMIKNAMLKVEEHKEKIRKEAFLEKEKIIETAKNKAEELKKEALKKLEEELKESKKIIEKEIDSLSEKLISNILNQKN